MSKNKANLKIYKNTKIYVLAPPWLVGGGPEALHQLVYYLSKCGYDAFLTLPSEKVDANYQIPKPYKKYVDKFITFDNVVDSKENIFIFPESYGLDYFRRFKNLQKAVWFLGVQHYRAFYRKDFTFFKKIERIYRILKYFVLSFFGLEFFIKNDSTVKLVASHYAYDYIAKHHGNPKLMIEPISLEFIEIFKNFDYKLNSDKNRKNSILYNPIRGDNELMVEQLKSLIPEYKFIPIKGYTHEEMIELMNNSKVYIDFGTFPGAERIPKEAVVCGMCIITGRNGASNYHGDVPIPDKYKFKQYKNQLDDISIAIKDLMENYSDRINEFDEYRKTVYNLEENFIKQIKEVFPLN